MYLATFAGQNLRTVAEQSFDATLPLWLISNLHLDDVLLIINKLSLYVLWNCSAVCALMIAIVNIDTLIKRISISLTQFGNIIMIINLM